ncbi:hypothetical protein OG342_05090 [Streptomyces bobili]|uniref:hypothetical protein n=1 Tax=Streptomyces bobili TaxID=67280 RepID=UPI0022501B1F|nr:hypothetical protein [Streptomyces bobili]MCX5522243.1 hypothetical protein [Streptomyces bobili]
MTTALMALALLALGYTLGRLRPLHRALDWANWQSYRTARPAGLRYAAMFALLSAENLTWLAAHPAQGWHAWKHRNDPPPPRSPAVRINDRPGPR